MGSPGFARREIIAIEKVGDGFTVAVLTPPTGIWRATGGYRKFDRYIDALRAAGLLAISTGGSILMDREAAIARPEEGAHG